jgi:N utilization substance protein B
MGIRRISRETALQFLYQEDFTINPGQEFGYDLEERFDLFCTLFQVNKKAKSYALTLLKGICARLDEIDAQISKATSNWRLTRIAATDRNLLRIAVYEIIYGENVPAEVAINEVVEIAKKFAGEESPKFINGILDAILTSQKS